MNERAWPPAPCLRGRSRFGAAKARRGVASRKAKLSRCDAYPNFTPSALAQPRPASVPLRGLYSQPTKPSNPLASISLNR